MSGAPLLATITNDLSVYRIGLDPVAMIIGPSPTLAIRLTAGALLGAVGGRLKDLLTVTAAARGQARLLRLIRNQSLKESKIAAKWI
jgi:hypothetical protein